MTRVLSFMQSFVNGIRDHPQSIFKKSSLRYFINRLDDRYEDLLHRQPLCRHPCFPSSRRRRVHRRHRLSKYVHWKWSEDLRARILRRGHLQPSPVRGQDPGMPLNISSIYDLNCRRPGKGKNTS